MTPNKQLGPLERDARFVAEVSAQEKWGARAGGVAVLEHRQENWPNDAYVLAECIPDTVRFREDAGRDVAYLDDRQSNHVTRDVFNAVGAEIGRRIGL